MEIVTTDVAIIGAGGAGLRAAIALAEADPKGPAMAAVRASIGAPVDARNSVGQDG